MMNIFLMLAVVLFGIIFVATAIIFVLMTMGVCSAIYMAAYPTQPKFNSNFDFEKSMDDLSADLEKMAQDWNMKDVKSKDKKSNDKKRKNINILSFEKYAK